MTKKLDITKPVKIIEAPRGSWAWKNREALYKAVVKIKKIIFVYDNGDVGGNFKVMESDSIAKGFPLVILRVTLKNI